MLGREKPFEILSGKEKEAYKLASEILAYTSKPGVITWPGVGPLREQATELHELVSKMDIEYDDRYYQVYDRSASLQRAFDQLKLEIESDLEIKKFVIDFNPESASLETLWPAMQHAFETGAVEVVLMKENRPSTFEGGTGYGDWFQIRILDYSQYGMVRNELRIRANATHDAGVFIPSEGFGMRIMEMLDENKYVCSPYSSAVYAALEKNHGGESIDSFGRTYSRKHDAGVGFQLDALINYRTIEEIRADLPAMIQAIKDTPRKPIGA